MRSSLAIWLWSSGCARWSAYSVSARTGASPSTLTNTRAWRRSGLVSTAVTVTKPMRGSLRPSAIRDERTSRSASLTRRMRSPGTLLPQYLAGRDESALEAHAVGELRLDIAHHLVAGGLKRT